MILTIELSNEAWQRLQAHLDMCGLTAQELIEHCSLELSEPGTDTFMNTVSLVNVIAYAIAQNKYNSFMDALQAMWGTSDRLSELTDELEEEFAEN